MTSRQLKILKRKYLKEGYKMGLKEALNESYKSKYNDLVEYDDVDDISELEDDIYDTVSTNVINYLNKKLKSNFEDLDSASDAYFMKNGDSYYSCRRFSDILFDKGLPPHCETYFVKRHPESGISSELQMNRFIMNIMYGLQRRYCGF